MDKMHVAIIAYYGILCLLYFDTTSFFFWKLISFVWWLFVYGIIFFVIVVLFVVLFFDDNCSSYSGNGKMSMTDASTKILEIPALERDFREGALYDARSEQIVTGYSLWDSDDLKNIETHRNESTNYSMNASNTLSEKFNGLDISASVEPSILSGLIKLGKGSAAYLKKEKNTRGKCSVQVKCFYKTGYKEMEMKQLRNIRYPDLARTGNNNTATHFVTKIQYGAGAIFTFTKQFQSSEKEKKVEAKAELHICGKTIKGVLDGSYERNYRNYSSHSQIKCEFQSFGLSLGEDIPTTYDEAVKFAGNFGRMAHRSIARHGGEALGVPCVVWLQPLASLPGCANAPRLHYEFTLDQACEWIKFLEDCDELENLEVPWPSAKEWKFSKEMTFTKGYPKVDGYKYRNSPVKLNFIQFRSKSTEKFRETIVKIRSGLIPIDCFNKEISSLKEILSRYAFLADGWDSVRDWDSE